MLMKIAAVRIVAAVLADATYGINAQLDQVVLEGADQRPPNITAILNEFDHIVRIRERPASNWPIVLVFVGDEGLEASSEIGAEAVVTYRDATVPVIIARLAESAGGPRQSLDAAYTEEAIVRSMDRGLLDPARFGTAGARGNVQLLQAIRLSAPAIPVEQHVGTFEGVVRYDLQLRHNTP